MAGTASLLRFVLRQPRAAQPRWPPDIEPLPSPVGDGTWERLRQATVDLVIERGYDNFEIADIVERAGATREQFDARFSGKDDCRERTYEANISDFDHALVVPFLREPNWRAGLRAAAYGAVEYLRHHRRERRYGELRKRLATPMVQVSRDRYLQRVVDLIDVGRCEMDDPTALGRSTAEGAFGSIYGLLLNRLQKTDGEGLSWQIFDDVLYLAMRPYIGHEAAMREIATFPSRRFVKVRG